jgi:hypothetical protein
MRNVGDNAFCVVLDWALTRYWGTESPVFAAPPLVDLPADRAAMSQALFESLDPVSRAGKLLTKAGLLGGASMLLFGGGSVFRDMGPFSEKKVFAAWSRVSRRPIAAVGVSVGPFSGSPRCSDTSTTSASATRRPWTGSAGSGTRASSCRRGTSPVSSPRRSGMCPWRRSGTRPTVDAWG